MAGDSSNLDKEQQIDTRNRSITASILFSLLSTFNFRLSVAFLVLLVCCLRGQEEALPDAVERGDRHAE